MMQTFTLKKNWKIKVAQWCTPKKYLKKTKKLKPLKLKINKDENLGFFFFLAANLKQSWFGRICVSTDWEKMFLWG